MKKNTWTVKDKLEIIESICTIIVSIMALWGSIVAIQHNLFQKAGQLIEHYHKEIVKVEQAIDL